MSKKVRPSLFSPAVGGKSKIKKYPIDDYRNYRYVVEPFVHSGPLTLSRLLKFGTIQGSTIGIVADSDPSVYSIWQAWLDEEIRWECMRLIDHYHPLFSKDAGIKKEDIKICDSHGYYLELKEVFNKHRHTPTNTGEMAGASLLLRKLVFGGVMRCSKKGLNVTLSWDKLKAFPRWTPSWHLLDEQCKVDLSLDWQDALHKLESVNQPFLMLVDPPYWLPYEPGSKRRGTGAMTQAYVEHDPSGEETFKMAVESVERGLKKMTPASRIVHTNYWSRPMQQAMERLSREYGVPVWTTQLDVMTGMNKSRANTTNRIETAWEFGGKRMFYPKGFNSIEQKELLIA